MNKNVEQMEVKEIDEETLANLIKEILESPEKYQSEAKYLLTLHFERRRGCGYVYDYDYDIATVFGEADIVTLQRNERTDCSEEEKLVVIPKTVPVVLVTTEWDESPHGRNILTIYAFDGNEWKSMALRLSHPLKYLSKSIFD